MAVMALWLRGAGGSADIVVPLAPAPAPLVAGRHYSDADFLAALRPAAQAKLAADAPGKGACFARDRPGRKLRPALAKGSAAS